MKKHYLKQPPVVRILLLLFLAITLLFTACKKQKSDDINIPSKADVKNKISLAAMLPTNPIKNADVAYDGFLKAYLITSGAGAPYFCQSLTNRKRAFFWQQCYLITSRRRLRQKPDNRSQTTHFRLIDQNAGPGFNKLVMGFME